MAPSERAIAMTDFFISYTQADRPWAEWIDSILRAAGYTTKMQAWDFRPGQNFVVEMHRATADSARTIAVLSPDYQRSLFATAEWAAAFVADPDGSKGKLVPVLVRETNLEGLLPAIIHIRLVDLEEAAAREALLKGLVPGSIRPESVRFPGVRLFPGPSASPPSAEMAEAALEALPVDEVPAPGPLPVGSRMPFAVNPLFVGRDEVLKTLARQLRAQETAAVGQIAAASGLGGIGKTQLASEFVHRYGRFFKGGVFWMSFADAGAVPVEIAACGSSLVLHLNFETLTLDQQVRLVEEAWKTSLPRLLVFDNCEEEELLRRWRPPFGGARILVTSRRSDWDPTLGVKTVSLTTLTRPASLELLCRFRADLSVNDAALDGIASELGDLPLALHLAGSFLRAYRNSDHGQPTSYLDALRKAHLLAHPSLEGRGSGLSPTGHEAHVGRTFAVSFERLDPASSVDALATDILARAAWFAPGEPIPRSLLLKTVQANSADLMRGLDAEDALQRLVNLGFVERTDRNDLLMHRLVAAWARGAGKGNEARSDVELALISESMRINEARNPVLLLAWQPHLRAVTDRALGRNDGAAARLCHELGFHLWEAGKYLESQPYLEQAAMLHEEFSGPEHPETAKSLNILGCALHSQGNYPEARSCYERSLRIRESAYGQYHSDTACSLNDLGNLLLSQGNYEGARSYLERALSVREKVLGTEHTETAISYNSLGSLLQHQGSNEGALIYFERALTAHEKALGTENPRTAVVYSNLGSLLQFLKDYEGARSYLERALAIREKALGPEHPETAIAYMKLGDCLCGQGEYEKAQICSKRALTLLEKVLGPDHPTVATNLHNLGGILQGQGDWVGARAYTERALRIREKVLGPDHPDTASSLLNLGVFWLDQGNADRARWCMKRALIILTKRLGREHPDTRHARGLLGNLPGARRSKKQSSKKKS